MYNFLFTFCQATRERAGLIWVNNSLRKEDRKEELVDRNWMLKTEMAERQTKRTRDSCTGTYGSSCN